MPAALGYSAIMRAPLFLVAAAAVLAPACSSSTNSSTSKGTIGADGGESADGGSPGTGGDDGSSPAGDDATTGSPPGGDGGATDGGARTPDGGARAADGGTGVSTVGGLFEQPEPWTLDVSGVAPSTRSAAIIAALDSMGGWGGGTLQIDFSIPLFSATTSTPRQTITAPGGTSYCYGGPDCDAVPLQMPMPANGNTEGSASYACDTSYKTNGQGDCHVLVVETNQKKLYEIYNATKSGSAFTALGAFVWDLTKAYPDNLRGDQCTSADAAGFPIAGLLPTADEVAAGAVKHAVRFILPNPSMKKDAYVHPATHAGSPASTNANAPPYGVRFRLKSSFAETSYGAGEKTILQAMKTYGMLLSDGGTIALTFADDRTTTAKWAAQGITAQSFSAVTVDDFEVVDLGPEIVQTDSCVRNP
jgi:hypothetical protein